MAYNLLSCGGFGTGLLGPCSMAWFGLVITFFIIALVRKWGGEEMGIEFNFWIAIAVGLIANFITVTITGNYKIALVIGLAAGIGIGYGSGLLFGGGGDSE